MDTVFFLHRWPICIPWTKLLILTHNSLRKRMTLTFSMTDLIDVHVVYFHSWHSPKTGCTDIYCMYTFVQVVKYWLTYLYLSICNSIVQDLHILIGSQKKRDNETMINILSFSKVSCNLHPSKWFTFVYYQGLTQDFFNVVF